MISPTTIQTTPWFVPAEKSLNTVHFFPHIQSIGWLLPFFLWQSFLRRTFLILKYWDNIMNEGVSEAETRLDRLGLAVSVSCRWISSQVSKLIKSLYMKNIYTAALVCDRQGTSTADFERPSFGG